MIARYELRVLNGPRPLEVQADDAGVPVAVRRAEWPELRALRVEDCWRIDDEWWREQPVSRMYYTLQVEGGLRLTAFHDLLSDGWFEQHDGKRPATPSPEHKRSTKKRAWLRR